MGNDKQHFKLENTLNLRIAPFKTSSISNKPNNLTVVLKDVL